MPNRQKIILMSMPLLALALIVVWLPNLRKLTGSEKVSMKLVAIDKDKLKGVHLLIRNSPLGKSPRMSEFEGWGRDPFNQKTLAAPELADPYPLRGIFWDEIKPSALIGETVVYVGDRLDKFTVTNIQPDYVVISDGHAVLKLRMD